MKNTNHRPSFTDFWKTPSDFVCFITERTNVTDTSLIVSMPPKDYQTKPLLYHWGGAHLYTPIQGNNSRSADISNQIIVDPPSRTVFLPFNLNQAVMNLVLERYERQESSQSLLYLSRQLYYKFKPFLPRLLQVLLRQIIAISMRQRKFPEWEIDASLNILYRNLLSKLLEINPQISTPVISFWPDGAELCLLLSHDVETLAGIANIPKIMNIEQKLGFRSVWNFVPQKYHFDINLLNELEAAGFEIGVHGLYHDGRLFESHRVFQKRVAIINDYMKKWGSVGFRSESNLRNLGWMSSSLQAAYDSSDISTEWYGAQPGGCCTVFPFIYGGLVELPITLQQDFTLLDVLNLTCDETLIHWINSVRTIKELNGMVLINTHPDYLNTDERLMLYENFLLAMKRDSNYWHALPKDASRWWLDRHNSELLRRDNGWEIYGPAHDRGKVMNVSLTGGKLTIRSA